MHTHPDTHTTTNTRAHAHMAAYGTVSPTETWEDRGHLPAHEVDDMSLFLQQALDDVERRRKRLREAIEQLSGVTAFPFCSNEELFSAQMAVDANRRRLAKQQEVANLIMDELETHDLSFDMVTRAVIPFTLAGRVDPFADWPESEFRVRTRFNKDSLLEVLGELKLLPAGDIFGKDGTRCPLPTAVTIMLARFASADTWDKMQHQFNVHRSYLITTYTTIRDLVHEHYGVTVTSFDYLRIRPELPLWDQTLTERGSGIPGVVCFIDGKAWR